MMTSENPGTDTRHASDNVAQPAGVNPAEIWKALIADTQCCVVLAEADGKIRYGNFDEANSCGGFESCPVQNAEHLSEALPAEQAAHLIKCMKRACQNNAPIILIWFLRGQRSRTVIRPVDGENGSLVLLTTRSVKSANFNEETTIEGVNEVVHSVIGDAGPLASLTQRETQVLELIGRGYSTAKIAEHLDRSTKTIEWHRASIGNKLKASNRVELARMAISAGLTAL